MIRQLKVGYYAQPFGTDFKEYSLEAILNSFGGDFFKSKLDEARALYSAREFEKYTLFKETLPAVTFSGTFFPSRSILNLKSYSSLIIMDIDKVGANLDYIKDILSNDPYVLAVWLSPSADGFKYLIVNNQSKDDHKSVYAAAVHYYRTKYNIEVDTSGSDIPRLCFVSHDPNIKINYDCVPFDQIYLSDVIKEVKSKYKAIKVLPPILKANIKNDELSKATYKRIYHYLKKRKMSITDNHNNWIRVAYALSNTFNHSLGRQYFLDLCRLDGMKHDEELSEKLINNCYLRGLSQSSFATILFLAKQRGFDVEFNKKNKNMKTKPS
ncbi:BT4734/BF3469 family protein [Pedobacter sp. FW305-3-2-15-E-R2A2]|uniref:BT4734/BF3469 family protein n=1 Tax=Pedobacter sp. FW305-3-2-15-E-R2A2 TaxID=3140251 RepID=UPI0031403628